MWKVHPLLLRPDHPPVWDMVLQHGRILVVRLVVGNTCFYGTFPPLQWTITASFILWVLQTISHQLIHNQLHQVCQDAEWS